MQLANRMKHIEPSPTLALNARVGELKKAGKNIINLTVGEPDFDTPEFIKQAAIKAILEGKTKYTPVDGTPSLKQAIINKFSRENNLSYQAKQIIITSGAKQAIYNLFQAYLNPGDEVIIPAPYWVSYPEMVKMAEGVPVFIETSMATQFKISPAQLKQAITPKTKAIIINSPSNPSGSLYSERELAELGKVLLNFNEILIISDDIYEHIIWESVRPAKNIINACPDLYARAVVINGVSKSYAMTGWRIGYAAGDMQLINAMKDIQSQSTSNACSIAQAATEAALNGDQNCLIPMLNAFKARHDYVISALREIAGVKIMPSVGTFYAFPNISELIQILSKKYSHVCDDLSLSEFLLEKAGVAVVPGSSFGCPDHLRLSFAIDLDSLKSAFERFKNAVK